MSVKDVFFLAYNDKEGRKLSLKLEGFELDQDTYPEWEHREAVNEHMKALAKTVMELDE